MQTVSLDFAARAAAFGDRTAIRTEAGSVTYAALAARVETARAALLARGVGAGDRVALACKQTLATIEAALALLELRCTVLPLAGDAPAEAREMSLASFGAAWEICESGVTARAGRAAPVASEGDTPLQALLSSGSTGRPKIVLRSAAQVRAGVRIFSTAMQLTAEDRVLLLVPLAHSFGFNSVMLGTLTAGAQVVLSGSTHPRGIAREVERNGVTLLPAPPLFFDYLLRFSGESARLRSLRRCVSLGDILPRATHGAFVDRYGVPLWQSYGASEAGPVLLNRDGAPSADTLALGRPYPEVEVEIRDDGGTPLPDGEVGEISVRSPAVGIGYLGEHDSASRFEGREFFTGDLGFRREGEIHFAGRRKVLLTRAGRKIDPAEIERVLRTHPQVADAGVRALDGDGPLQALVVTRRCVRAEELIELCARSLEPYKIPRLIEFRRELPRDGAGKLQRERLGTW